MILATIEFNNGERVHLEADGWKGAADAAQALVERLNMDLRLNPLGYEPDPVRAKVERAQAVLPGASVVAITPLDESDIPDDVLY